MLRSFLSRKPLSGQEAENYWKHITELYYYPLDKYVLIYPEGEEVKISPVERVTATGLWQVDDLRSERISYGYGYFPPAEELYFIYKFSEMSEMVYYPDEKTVRIWA